MRAWLESEAGAAREPLRDALDAAWLAEEIALTRVLAARARLGTETQTAVEQRAARWVHQLRAANQQGSTLDAFLREYDLSSEEGVLLLCLAEALLRIPDAATAEQLIAEKLVSAAWQRHLGRTDSLLVNASTWGLMLTGRVVHLAEEAQHTPGFALGRVAARIGESAVRLALRQAMHLMAQQFVMGRSIGEALGRARTAQQPGDRHSFDMLGEAALTSAHAEQYFVAYRDAIATIGGLAADPDAPVHMRPGISVKLSALHPRYEYTQAARVQRELVPRLLELSQLARRHNIGLTVDAEETDRLDLSLDVIEPVFRSTTLSGWEGFGLAVQAYQKRALPLIDWLHELASRAHRRLAVRLVKGAYWDSEIKRAQELGLDGYPVFTRKSRTDVSYLACARRLLDARDHFYPMLATHNAQAIAAVLAYAGDEGACHNRYEFQRLHGMGEALYAVVRAEHTIPCRVYAPVGTHEDLLPYLVRRLLENGANTSFVNRVHEAGIAPEQLVADPCRAALEDGLELPVPAALFGESRRNSAGINLADWQQRRTLGAALAALDNTGIDTLTSVLAVDVDSSGPSRRLSDPADPARELGRWQALDIACVAQVVQCATEAQPTWDLQEIPARAACLDRAADALESDRTGMLHLLVREAGKTLPDAIAEVREATDFLRYYAAEARRRMMAVESLPATVGEENTLRLAGRGVFACISPWNFPLAIFTGQIAAALVCGNAVIAKPAEQTPRIAQRMTRLLHETGIPRVALQLVLGDGAHGEALVSDPRVAGVAFTGSLEVARRIQFQLATRTGGIGTLIAETGGQNALIADSSALPEQLVRDAMRSAFGSAGQRCSALRVLYVQEEIADRVIELLRGAMREWTVGDPRRLDTDLGPLIDEDARDRLMRHRDELRARGQLLEQEALPMGIEAGFYFAPCLALIGSIAELDAEHFGPILHVARFKAEQIDGVVDRINACGYGLTLGVHSRIEATWRRVQARARVGNLYINRGITGAVVGSQPFGGEGLSGTGPKAGGPHYLTRFVVERCTSINTAAIGGDARLLRR